MPLTLSHPAAAVPFVRFRLVLSALVIGSMIPDFPYFIPFSPDGKLTHSITGVFIYCFPAGLAALFLFHWLLKPPAFSLLPASHQERLYMALTSFSFGPPDRFLKICFSLLIGSLTHIAWDGFTHPDGWAVDIFPGLKLVLFQLGFYDVAVYKLLQHLSTLLGGLLLAYWYIVWYRKSTPASLPGDWQNTEKTKMQIILGMGGIAVLAASLSSLLIPVKATGQYLQTISAHLVIVCLATLVAQWLLFSIYWHIQTKNMS